jgi:hypothetical protein
MSDILSVSFEKNAVTLDKGVSVDFSDIEKITCDLVKRTATIHIDIKGKKLDYEISMKSAYALILIIGASPWVNL